MKLQTSVDVSKMESTTPTIADNCGSFADQPEPTISKKETVQPCFLQLQIKNFDGQIAGAKLSVSQARQIMNYAERIGVKVHQVAPIPSIESHNAVATYYGGVNYND